MLFLEPFQKTRLVFRGGTTLRLFMGLATALAVTITAPNATASDPAVYVRSDDVNAVVYRGANNHIYEISLARGGTAWHFADLTSLTGAPSAAGDPAAYVRSDHVNAVVFRGFVDNHIHEIWLPLGGAAWGTSDLSALSGAPSAFGDPAAYVRSDRVNAVVFRGAVDSDIHEIWLPLGGTAWRTSDLSALTGLSWGAGGNPAGYVRSDYVNAVLVGGFDNSDIHEIWLPLGGTAWRTSDLSALSGTVWLVGDAFGYVRSDRVNAVVFRGFDSKIHEISLPLGGTAWGTSDLSALTGAPPAM